jgi:hypothetical protein
VGRLALPCLLTALVAVVIPSAEGARSPTKAQVVAQTRAVVRGSGSRLISLQVAPPRSYRLVVKPAHPARYLKHRANAVVDVMNHLTRGYRMSYFAVLGPSGQRVLWVEHVRAGNGETIRWNVRNYLADCVRTLNLGIEVDPDHAAPTCPSR